MAPSPLLVGDEENPVEFEWKCEVIQLKNQVLNINKYLNIERFD